MGHDSVVHKRLSLRSGGGEANEGIRVYRVERDGDEGQWFYGFFLFLGLEKPSKIRYTTLSLIHTDNNASLRISGFSESLFVVIHTHTHTQSYST